MKTLLPLGASGQVGQQVLTAALASPTITQVCATTRRPLAAHPRLLNPIINYASLPPKADWWQADAVICTLGSTLLQAGSPAAFRAIDFGYVLAAANIAYQAGTPIFVLNSSLGANPQARSLYLRVKGETEASLQGLGFSSVITIRPSLLTGTSRSDSRPTEKLAIWLNNVLGNLIPRRYRPVSINQVAHCLLATALNPKPGFSIVESENINFMTHNQPI